MSETNVMDPADIQRAVIPELSRYSARYSALCFLSVPTIMILANFACAGIATRAAAIENHPLVQQKMKQWLEAEKQYVEACPEWNVDGALISDEVVIQQAILYVMRVEPDPMHQWGRLIGITRQLQWRYGMTPLAFATALVPLLESESDPIRRHAFDMLQNSGVLSAEVEDVSYPYAARFEPVEQWLKSPSGYISPPLLSCIYGVDPDAALRTLARARLDSAAIKRLEGQQLRIRASLWQWQNSTDDAERETARRQALEGLTKIAQSEHAFIRAYVPAVRLALRKPFDDVGLMQRLAEDPDPIVSRPAQAVMKRDQR